MRGLQKTALDLSPAYLAASVPTYPSWLPNVLFILFPVLFLGGCAGACVASFSHGNEGVWGIWAFLAIPMLALAYYMRFRWRHVAQAITVRELFESSHFSVLVEDPLYAKPAEQNIVKRLAALKAMIDENTDTPQQVIEL